MKHNEPRAPKHFWTCTSCGTRQSVRSWERERPADWRCGVCRQTDDHGGGA